MDPAIISTAISLAGPILTAIVDALGRGDDWRKAAREALDAADAADHGLVGPRADAIEARHRARIAAEAAVLEAAAPNDRVIVQRILASGLVPLSHEERGALSRIVAATGTAKARLLREVAERDARADEPTRETKVPT